jgi:hypothetical protein
VMNPINGRAGPSDLSLIRSSMCWGSHASAG